jgi:hypothetical protein
VQELRPALYRWTASHPAWEEGAEPESPGDWPREVGSVLYDAGESVILVDPLVADWAALDELVAERPVAVLTTVRWHSRSREDVLARYAAAPAQRVETIAIERADETMVWIPEHRALVPGDRLIGDCRGGVRICPESWLRYIGNGITLDELRERLRPLLDLPVELVLVSHGEPVLAGGRVAIQRALG